MNTREENYEERGYPEVCTYTISSTDDYDDYQEGSCYFFNLNYLYFYILF